MPGETREAVRTDEATAGGLSSARGRSQVVAIAATVALLGGGGGGYYLHGATVAPAPAPDARQAERLLSLEQWRAAQQALEERNREDRSELVRALRDSSATNASLREAVVALTERLDSTRATVTGLESRLRLVEQRQP